MSKPTAAIIGHGRFGQVLEKVLTEGFEIRIFHHTDAFDFSGVDYIFPCVPIDKFEACVQKMIPSLKPGMSVVDVCSVKCHPKSILEKHLPDGVAGILTHPLFGPDSYENKSAHKIMMDPESSPSSPYQFLKTYFESQGFTILEMSSNEHDKQAANSQVVTHFIGRVFEAAGIEASPDITTLGFEKLLEVKAQTCHDTPELFHAMVRYNPHAKGVIDRITQAALGVSKL